MFKAFTFKSLASLSLIMAVACVGAADPALARKKKPEMPGYWERSEDGGFDWNGPRSTRPRGGQPVVRDHRGEDLGGGVGVTVMPDGPGRKKPIVRDHRVQPIVRDNRKKKKIFGMPVSN